MQELRSIELVGVGAGNQTSHAFLAWGGYVLLESVTVTILEQVTMGALAAGGMTAVAIGAAGAVGYYAGTGIEAATGIPSLVGDLAGHLTPVQDLFAGHQHLGVGNDVLMSY